MRDGTQTRLKLERCALTLFVKKGIDGTTIKDIAHKANIAEGTLYRHYKSKDELASSLYLNGYEAISKQMMALGEKQPTLNKKIKVMIEFFCQNYDEDPILFNYLLLSQHSQIKYISEKGLGAHEFFVAMFNDAMRKKELPKRDADFCAAVLLGIVLQAAVSRVYGRITRTMAQDADDLTTAVLSALK